MNRNKYNRSHTIEDIKRSFIEPYEAEGIDRISIRGICEKAGISRTIFYRYFDDKYQVLEHIEDELIEGVRQINCALVQAPLSEYQKGRPFPVFVDTARYIRTQEHYFRPLLNIHGDPQFIFRWKKQIRSDVRQKFIHDKITWYTIDVVIELFAAAIVGLYTYWFFENPALSCEELSEIAGNLLCGSLYNFCG